MRVIHLIGGGDTGGAKTHVLNLLKELNNSIDAKLVCFRRGDFSEDALKLGIPIDVIESGNPLKGLSELKKIIGKDHIDIIHCHGARGNLMGNMIKKYLQAPVVTTVHSDYRLDYLGRPVARLSYGTTNMLALRRVNYYIGVSDPMADILIERNFPAEKIYTIYNGIDFRTPIKTVGRDEFFSSLGFEVNSGDVVAGIAARLNPVKDIPTLLQAMKLAREKAPNLKLVIAGDGEDEQKLKAMAKELGIEESVCFAGWVGDINSFYHAIDINLLTSVSETFPYALTEGTRMKRATIASNVGGVPVLIDDGKNGFIFTPGDSDELAGYLSRLALDSQLRERMGELIYQKASEMFSIDKMVDVQLEIYQSILEREKRAKGKKRDGIIICGAYGHGNAGDDAILKSIIKSVRQTDEHMPLTILAKNTMSIKKKFRVSAVYTFNVLGMMRAMRKSRLYINGGGSLIQNVTSRRSLWYYLFTLRMAKFCKNKVDMYGCGIGPITGVKNMRLVKKVLNRSVDIITLRDRVSFDALKEFGVTKPDIIMSSDPALTLLPAGKEEAEEYIQKHGLSSDGKYVCFILRTWYGFSEKAEDLAKCADYAYEKLGLTPVFLSFNIYNDTAAANQVTRFMHSPYTIIDDKAEPEMLMSALSYMDVVVSMRLHGLILSSISGVPLVGIAYDPKISSFIDYIGYGECAQLSDVTAENLCVMLRHAYKESDREKIRERAEMLAQMEVENINAVKKLLNE